MSLSPVLQVILRLSMFLLVAGSVGASVWAFLTQYSQRHLLKARLRVAQQVQTPSTPGAQKRNPIGWLVPAATLSRLRTGFEERRLVSGFPLTWNAFVTVSVGLSVLLLFVGFTYFQNLLAALAMAVMGLLLPDQVLSTGASVHQDKTHEQLQMAIHTFSTEYRHHRNVQRALLETAKQLPEPIRFHMDQAARGLNTGRDPEEVFAELALRLNHPFARIFISNCRAVMENQQASPLFESIAYQLNQWRVRQTQKRAALAGGKTIGLVLNAALIPVYLVNVRIQPNTHVFFTQVAMGRGLLVLMLAGVLLTFGVNKYLASTDW